MRLLLLLFSALCLLAACQAKPKSPAISAAAKSSDSLAAFPYWIEMMNNPNAHYQNTVDAFDAYWAKREKPAGKNGEARDIFGVDKSKDEIAKDNNRPIDFVVEYKQFLRWKQQYKNLVKADGTIMTQDEIIDQSNKELENR
jgi:hypothetical protein